MRRISFFLIATFAFVANSCNGQQTIGDMKENEVFKIWDTKQAISEKRTKDKVIFDISAIEALPESVKSIIIYYSTRISSYECG